MTKTYAVHYGRGHLGRCKVLDNDFTSLAAAQKAASKLVQDGHLIVLIADTDGNEWDMTGSED